MESDGSLTAELRPIEGETPIEFARRVSADDATAQRILALPGEPSRTRVTTLSYGALSNDMKRAVVTALFPSDVRATEGWLHIAVTDERLKDVAGWFSGLPGAVATIARLNDVSSESVSRGTTLRVPTELLLPPFRDAEAVREEEPAKLEFGEDEKGRYAVYRLRRKEALYSAVVVRFTGRLHAEDVIQLALQIALRSGIDDVHAIPVGYPVKIPLDVLSPEFLPADDPRAESFVRERAETSQFGAPAKASGLTGIRVVLDAGHGGRDTGTLHQGVWESTYVYDVVCRLRKLLLQRTNADVVMTSREPALGFVPPEQDRLRNFKGRVLLSDPPYGLDDPVVGVNLRWYLANSVLNRPNADRKKVPPERTVFISVHADSLHPSVRGAMVYVPGERFLRDRYGKSAATYAVFREFREHPVVSFSKKERVSAEGVSGLLAQKILGAFRDENLPVHPFSPIRTHVIRGGREWVPAVLRYNRIPNRVLLEIANLGNEEDRALTVTRSFRQKVAEAVVAGLVEFFGGEPAPRPRSRRAQATAAGARPTSSAAGPWLPVVGPWPPVAGPWPPVTGPWPVPAGPQASGRRSSNF